MKAENSYSIYKLLGVKGVGPVLVNKILTGLSVAGTDITTDLEQPTLFDELQRWLDDGQIEQFRAHDPRLSRQIQELRERNAHLVCVLDHEYPTNLACALGTSAPPILSCLGNLQLLRMPSVGFCGSRKASQKGLDVASDCVEQLVGHGVVFTSGYANGVDQVVHQTALECEGATIIVLPEGLLNFSVRPGLRDCWDWDRVLVISEFLPSDMWRASRAMQRNKTIIGLSRAMVVVEAGERGGTIGAGRTTLKMQRALHVVEYDDASRSTAGNRLLLGLGAKPLRRSAHSGAPNLDRLIEDVHHFTPSSIPALGQVTLYRGRP